MAVSEAILPQVPKNATRYGTTFGGTFRMEPRNMASKSPASSQNPMAMVMVMTRPKGANPVKFLTRLDNNQVTPSLLNKFWDTTALLVAGLIRLNPVLVIIAPIIATIINNTTNSIAGGGSLLQTVSIVFKKRSTQVTDLASFFAAISLSSFYKINFILHAADKYCNIAKT